LPVSYPTTACVIIQIVVAAFQIWR